MEYGIRLTLPDALPSDPRDACRRSLRDLLPEGQTVALYFGSEFCEDRVPDLAEAMKFCALAARHDVEPTLLTPIVSPSGLQQIDRLLAGLIEHALRPAVVFNDWGVFTLLRDAYHGLPRRAGRLMNRSLRDPRAYQDAPHASAAHDASRYPRLRQLFSGAGVSAIETDIDLDGGYLGNAPADADRALRRALHLPFTFAASGRNCPLKAALYGEGDGFSKALADPCPAPCRGKARPVTRDDSPMPLWRAGNTVFYEPPRHTMLAWLRHTDRLVLHAVAAP